jgi:2-haloacid dehalogenase
MVQAIVFDVNETLLDMAALDPHFEQYFGDARVRSEWFFTLEEAWLTATVTGSYHDFSVLARAALRMTAARRQLELEAAAESAILGGLRQLPPHPDVVEGLEHLRDAGLRLAALTNGTLSAAQTQLEHAGLARYFTEILSADEVKRLKPAPEPYRLAAARLGIEIRQMRMVAAHAWDVAGAAAAGCATAFLARPGKVPYPHAMAPDLIGADLVELSKRILEHDRPASGAE